MTTIDPAAERRDRESGYVSSSTALARTVVYGFIAALGGVLAAVGIGSFLGQFRTMGIIGINETSRWFDNGIPLGVFITCAILSIPVLLGACHQYTRWNRRFSGRTDRLVGIGPLSLVLIGFTAMLWFICQLLWLEPNTVGFSDRDAWGTGAWIWYWMKTWLPALPTALTVLGIVGGIGGRQRADRDRAIVEELLVSGRRVLGKITEVSGLPSAEASRTSISWTCRFTDADGQSRWLKRMGFYRSTRYPSLGGEVWILFDPATPGDTNRIFTCLPDPTASHDSFGPDSPSSYLGMDKLETAI